MNSIQALLSRKKYEKLFYVIILAFCTFSEMYAQNKPSFVVRNYTVEDGLPHNVCYGMIQDKQGYMWFGTDNGLARLDGGNFDVFTAADGLGTNYITNFAYYQDTLLIATWGEGIRYMDGQQFLKYPIASAIDHLNNIYVSNHNIAFSEQGPFIGGKLLGRNFKKKILQQGDVVTLLGFDDMGYGLISDNSFGFAKANQLLLFGNEIKGILQFTDSFSLSPYLPNIFGQEKYFASLKDTEGNVWFSGKGKLIRIHQDTASQVYQANLPKEDIISICQWDTAHLLLMTEAKLLQERTLYLYNYNTGSLYNLSEKLGNTPFPAYCYVDTEKNIWLSTDGDGIFQFKPILFDFFQEDMGLQNQFINDIEEDIDGNIWAGTKGGLFRMKTGQAFKEVYVSEKDMVVGFKRTIKTENGRFFISSPYLYEVKQDSMHLIEFENDLGVFPMILLNSFFVRNDTIDIPRATDFNSYVKQSAADYFYKKIESHHQVWDDGFQLEDVAFAPNGMAWLASNQGVFKQKYGEQHFLDTLNVVDGLLDNHANTILYIPKDSSLWIGTMNGLCHWKNGEMTCYTEVDGLIGNQCHALMLDHLDRLWIGTADGVSCFDGTDFISFNKQNGLPSDDVNCLMEDASQQLWVGGSKGVARLDISTPDFIRTPPEISIKKFLFNGKNTPYKAGESFPHQSTIQAEFLFGMATYSKEMLFQYKLGEQAWKKMKGNSFELLSLGSGNYKIQFRAKRLNSPWSKPFVLEFGISQPLWLQSWALGGYALVIVVITAFILRLNARRQTLKARQEIELLELNQLKEVNDFKSRFFDNISHEFRTPLTLILGSLEQLLQSPREEDKAFLEVSRRNAGVLLELINQLLALSKLESGKLSLDSKQYDLVTALQVFCEGFETIAEQQGIRFHLDKPAKEISFAFDKPKLKIVLSNLLSNAIKFTPEGGSVRLTLQKIDEQEQSYAVIQVEDTGAGISNENLPYIFDRFYQVDNSSTRAYEGTGIGLALAMEFVELHQGEIKVSSEVGKGSIFTVKLPFVQSEEIGAYLGVVEPIETMPSESKMLEGGTTDLPKLLMVEDNPDMGWYIHSLLSPFYFVSLAKNGVEGFKQANEWMPDLIISDVMMPGMNGIEMCQKLKSDEKTSHIPIILLTAKAGQEHVNEGLQIGADEYLTKPFNQDELLLRVKNMVAYRQRLRQMFHKKVEVNPSEITVNSADEQFLSRAIQIVEENMSDSDFKAADLVEAIGMSRSLLYKKLKVITDLSTSEFIRAIRLKRAAKLMEQSSGNLSDICYEVGFSSLSYFSRSFSKQFGIPPKEYQENLIK